MFCRRAEAQAFGCKAYQLRREDIEQGAPVIEHEYKTKRSKGADYYIENIGDAGTADISGYAGYYIYDNQHGTKSQDK